MILLAMNYPFEILTRIEAKFPKSCSVLLNLRSYKTRFCLFAVFIYIYIYFMFGLPFHTLLRACANDE